ITQIKDFSADPQELTVFNNKVWFVATQNPLGSSLWQSDGTADATTPTGLSGYAVAKPFAVTDDHLFYLDFRADQNKSHLWAVGKDSSTGLMHTTDGPDTIRDLTAKADSAYFVATDSQKHRYSLFRSTGLFFK